MKQRARRHLLPRRSRWPRIWRWSQGETVVAGAPLAWSPRVENAIAYYRDKAARELGRDLDNLARTLSSGPGLPPGVPSPLEAWLRP